MVVHRAYIYGTSFYPTPKQFLYFFARFVGFIQNSHPAFHDGLAKLLIPRMKERIGLPGDPIPLAMRLIACNQLGITNQVSLKALLAVQCEDGGWSYYEYSIFVSLVVFQSVVSSISAAATMAPAWSWARAAALPTLPRRSV